MQAGRTTSTKKSGVPETAQKRDALRIVEIFVEDSWHRCGCQVGVGGGRVSAPGECQELHEEPLVRALRLPALEPAFFAEIRRFHSGAHRTQAVTVRAS